MVSPAEVGGMGAHINASELLGYPVCTGEPQEVLDLLWDRLNRRQQTHVVTLNAEMILASERQPAAREALDAADVYVADGVGLTWAARMLRKSSVHRYPGIDLVYDLMVRLTNGEGSVYLLGAKPGVADEAGKRLAAGIPGLRIAGTRDGYFSQEEEPEVVKRISELEPALLLVGMGCPRQERFILTHRDTMRVPLMVGVGGALEVFAGRRSRAPRWIRGTGFEWAFRAMQDTSRLKRVGLLPRFIGMVLTQAIRRAA
jgi:N-acetylglucosaminyldiphosphoundecaprenol N-acetyl-beta-D-mannosaminyltransferase